MADREKVIKGLECCMAEKICSSKCPYKGQCDDGGYYYSRAIEEAIELLKAQEPIEPVLVYEGVNKEHNNYKCPECHTHLCYGKRYCEWCGRKVKWDG